MLISNAINCFSQNFTTQILQQKIFQNNYRLPAQQFTEIQNRTSATATCPKQSGTTLTCLLTYLPLIVVRLLVTGV